MERGTALVTGGGTGIGAACCRALAAEGFRVAIHFRSSSQEAEALGQELPGSFLVQADLSQAADIDRLCDQLKAHGGDVSVLVNNAGIVRDAPLFSAGLEDFEAVMNANARAAWYLTKRISRLMMRKKSGRIINISSVIGHTGNIGQSVYGMSKAALDNFTKSAAQELAAYGILVNSIAPGFIETGMTRELKDELRVAILNRVPLGRMGQPAEVAELAAFLATKGAYCTGAVFHVNGGMYGG